MDQFKQVLRKRLAALCGYSMGLLCLAALGLVRPTAGETEEIRAFMAGMYTGLFTVVIIVVIASMVKYISAIKNEEKLKALYIYENDERRLVIQSKMGGAAIQWILSGMTAATLAAGFLNQTVFFTLLGALLFTATVKAVFKIVYTKKLT